MSSAPRRSRSVVTFCRRIWKSSTDLVRVRVRVRVKDRARVRVRVRGRDRDRDRDRDRVGLGQWSVGGSG